VLQVRPKCRQSPPGIAATAFITHRKVPLLLRKLGGQMEGSISSPSWESLLVAYLSGDCDFTTLYNKAKKPLLRVVARLAPFMPEDLREDVVQQTFMRLIENPPKHDPSRCSPRTLLFGLLRNAVRQVRAMFAPPGQTTRIHSEDDLMVENSSGELTAQRITPANEITPDLIEDAPSSRWTPDNTHALVRAGELLAKLPKEAGTAAWLVYALEYSITDTAAMMDKSRFAVARALRQVHLWARPELNAAAQREAVQLPAQLPVPAESEFSDREGSARLAS
jgi:DNA-directed RNA polymerase specialized sigma24 family protein